MSKLSAVILVGPIASGKGTVAEWLKKDGYVSFSYGDLIGIERVARGLPAERKYSNLVGAIMRLEFGNEIFAKKISQLIDEHIKNNLGNKILIDGLRHPDEIEFLKKKLGAKVIGVTASQEIRYQRVLARKSVWDPTSLKEFREVDIVDRGVNADSHENQSDACLASADVVIENNGDNIEVYKKHFLKHAKNLVLK